MRGGLVVSVQAAPGSPLAAPEHLAAIARAVEAGGAVGHPDRGSRDDTRDPGGRGRAGDRPGQAPHARDRGVHHARRGGRAGGGGGRRRPRGRGRHRATAARRDERTGVRGRGRRGAARAGSWPTSIRRAPAARRRRPARPRSRRRCPATPARRRAGRAGHHSGRGALCTSLGSRSWPRGGTARRRRSGRPAGRVPSRSSWAPPSRIRKSSRAGSRPRPPMGADG